MRVNTRYINSTKGTSSWKLQFLSAVFCSRIFTEQVWSLSRGGGVEGGWKGRAGWQGRVNQATASKPLFSFRNSCQNILWSQSQAEDEGSLLVLDANHQVIQMFDSFCLLGRKCYSTKSMWKLHLPSCCSLTFPLCLKLWRWKAKSHTWSLTSVLSNYLFWLTHSIQKSPKSSWLKTAPGSW